ncbi:MAG: hypothetical protein IT337_04300 [Thermomicrobiales bacterium]|nr:hypothetical protein [Thermomicrobiales bacterium]
MMTLDRQREDVHRPKPPSDDRRLRLSPHPAARGRTEEISTMDDAASRPYLPAGVAVVDTDGDLVGAIHAVYPHYIAIVAEGDPPTAYRAPFRAVFSFDGSTVTLRVQKDALDPMTPAEVTALGLPSHGGMAPAGTGTDNVGPAAGLTFGEVPVEDGESSGQSLENADSRDGT